AFFNRPFISSTVVMDFNSRFKMAREPLGTGTRIAFDVSFPARTGNTFATALPAPVSVITIFNAAARPRLDFLWKLSTRFWSLVYEWMVSIWPFTIPIRFSSTARTGEIALVVHEAAENILSFLLSASYSFTP